MNGGDAPGLISGLPKLGDGPGLHRMLGLCREFLNTEWWSQLDAIKVTGSNGKGSVSALVASVLHAAGVEVGLYTSPHLFEFRERIVSGQAPMTEEELARAVSWLRGVYRDYSKRYPEDRVAAFEATTAIALYHFATKRPEIVVAEAGIGGRFDSTRLVPGRTTALVSLDLEHTALLGRTLEEIAYDKADIAAAGSTLVVGPLPPEPLRRLRGYAEIRRLELVAAADVCVVRRCRLHETGSELDFELGGRRMAAVELALAGEHQVANAQVALTVAADWLSRNRRLAGRELESAVRRGCAELRWPCRLERLRRSPDVFVDAGHTPAAVAAVKVFVREVLRERSSARLLLVLGVSNDKDVEEIAATLGEVADEVIVTRASRRAAPVDKVAEAVLAAVPNIPLSKEPRLENALKKALAKATASSAMVLVAGGLFLAAETASLAPSLLK